MFLTSIGEIGKMGESLTKDVLQSQYKNADILEQANIKLDGASMVADFVVVQDGRIVGVFESKVPQSMQGLKVDPSKIQKGVYRWDADKASFVVQ